MRISVYLVCLVERYHSIVFFNPSLRKVMALKPNSFSALLVSNILLGCPSSLSGLSGLFGPGEIAENWASHPVRYRYGPSGINLSGLFG